MQSPNDVVIVSALRTPLCRSKKGALAKVPPATLLSTVLTELLDRTQTPPQDVDDICIGNCLLPPSGFAALRMAQIAAGIPPSTPFKLVNRQCSSGLQAVADIANAIATNNSISIGIGGGVESMSYTPMSSIQPPETTVDWGTMQSNPQAMDCLIPMGITSDNVVSKYGLHRSTLDQFAMESHHKAARAQAAGYFHREIVSVGNVTKDDGIRSNTSIEILSQLQPVFSKTGQTTAGNSSQTTDGAAAVLLMSRAEATKRGLPILGVWRGYAVKGVPPHIMGIGPAVAIPAVLKQTNLTIADIDVFEINEAFASQASWCVDVLNIHKEKVNPNGGAIALGHPLGCTGARQIATLLNEMHRHQHYRYGVVSMCIGTGMGAAAVIEVEHHHHHQNNNNNRTSKL
ncbi:acetyl-CoA c-acetyltransferase [Nitzschia inconspicua]|uniref:acetyl-CoA C-acyltransferase n=1 Tax=Nitzschia inconspicua TaxID=303405 RepID=A0A9K3PC82_9STRA|nr:acetyl-CoA c-acetyltransferase [Nitzschia inconspicua]KAG7362367.1 acetyl-CoA c-acetyltransferase [Nitzschia inconspicua]